MLHLFQPLASLSVGVAMTIYGLVHSITRYPGSQAFTTLAANMPAITSVLLFLLGVMAFVAGVLLIIVGVKTFQRRWRRFREVARHAGRQTGYDDEEWEPTYR